MAALALVASGCICYETSECKEASDCDGKPHLECEGGWQCVEGKCNFACVIKPPTDTTLGSVTTTLQATSTTLNSENLSLDSFFQGPCPEDYLKNRYKNDVILNRVTNKGTGLDYLYVTHYLDYVCCANITASMDSVRDGPYTVINIDERNVGGICRCICGYNVTVILSGLQAHKDYLVRVYGVDYKGKGSGLIKEVSTNPRIAGEGGFCGGIAGIRCRSGLDCKLDGNYPDAGGVCMKYAGGDTECSDDSGCAAGGCSGQVCITKKKAVGLITTCEWRQEYGCYRLTSCGCDGGKCAWRKNPAFDSCLRNSTSTPVF